MIDATPADVALFEEEVTLHCKYEYGGKTDIYAKITIPLPSGDSLTFKKFCILECTFEYIRPEIIPVQRSSTGSVADFSGIVVGARYEASMHSRSISHITLGDIGFWLLGNISVAEAPGWERKFNRGDFESILKDLGLAQPSCSEDYYGTYEWITDPSNADEVRQYGLGGMLALLDTEDGNKRFESTIISETLVTILSKIDGITGNAEVTDEVATLIAKRAGNGAVPTDVLPLAYIHYEGDQKCSFHSLSQKATVIRKLSTETVEKMSMHTPDEREKIDTLVTRINLYTPKTMYAGLQPGSEITDQVKAMSDCIESVSYR